MYHFHTERFHGDTKLLQLLEKMTGEKESVRKH